MAALSLREVDFDEVFDSQRTFRHMLDAMSRPGTIVSLASSRFVATPEGMHPHMIALLKTLCDNQVTFSVGAPERAEWARYIQINTATPYAEPEEADYVVFDGNRWSPVFAKLRCGDIEFPEASATALIAVQALADDVGETGQRTAARYRLSGPGVDGSKTFAVAGLDPAYVDHFRRMTRVFPMGIDLLLLDPEGRLVGLPRSVKMEDA